MTTPIEGGPVLVVDDDPDIRGSLIEILKENGHEAVGVANGYEALEYLKRSLPALILLDVMMPLMNGIQFRQEQMKNPVWQAVPVVVMTARSREELAAQGMQLEGLHYMRKPIDLRTLLALVRSVHNVDHASAIG